MSELPDELFTRSPEPKPFVTVTSGMRGHFAVLMCPCDEGWDVWMSGIGSYETREGAAREAREWAEAEGVAGPT